MKQKSRHNIGDLVGYKSTVRRHPWVVGIITEANPCLGGDAEYTINWFEYDGPRDIVSERYTPEEISEFKKQINALEGKV